MTAQAFPIRQELVRPAARPKKKSAPQRRPVAGPLKTLIGPRNLPQALDRAIPARRREIAEQSGYDGQAQKLTFEPYLRALVVRQLMGGSLHELQHGMAHDPLYAVPGVRLEADYRRRQHAPRRGSQWETPESLRAQGNKLRQGIARLIDSYAEGVFGKEEFEPQILRMKQRVIILEDRLQQLADDTTQQHDLRLIISRLEDFVAKVRGGLATADWPTRREIIRALVRRVEIDQQQVSVVFRIPPTSTHSGPDGGVLPDCRRGVDPSLWYNREQNPRLTCSLFLQDDSRM